MKIRLLVIVAAIVLAAGGTIALLAYVGAAEQRAYQGAQTRSVYIVNSPVPANTPAKELTKFIREDVLPASAIAKGAVTDLATLTGKVTAVPLIAGEQLLDERWVDPGEVAAAGTVAVPKGMQEVTVQLSPDRLVGGQLKTGDTVGFFVSFGDGPGDADETTHLVFHKLLVTSIQGAPATPADDPKAAPAAGPPVPGGAMLITFASKARDAEQIVFAAEFGKIWLSKEPASADTKGTRILEKDQFYP